LASHFQYQKRCINGSQLFWKFIFQKLLSIHFALILFYLLPSSEQVEPFFLRAAQKRHIAIVQQAWGWFMGCMSQEPGPTSQPVTAAGRMWHYLAQLSVGCLLEMEAIGADTSPGERRHILSYLVSALESLPPDPKTVVSLQWAWGRENVS
jgi:hypothetical protein